MLKQLLHRFTPPPAHPIDVRLGIHTSGTISSRRLHSGDAFLDHNNVGYVGSQPSVIRKALQAIWDVTTCDTFVDLGCGKGRALAVAADFPFHRLVGVELSASLAKVARRNLEILRARAVASDGNDEIVIGDASAPDLEGLGGTVVYLYNSFGEPLVRKLMGHLEAHVAARPDQKLWFVYYNPVWTSVVDESQAFRRFYADRVDFTVEEAKSHPFDNRFDSVVIWQSVSGPMVAPRPGHDRSVVVTIPGLGADVH